jgi:hypothetical protein
MGPRKVVNENVVLDDIGRIIPSKYISYKSLDSNVMMSRVAMVLCQKKMLQTDNS